MSNETSESIAVKIVQSDKNLPPLPAVGQRLLSLSRQPVEKIDVTSFSRLIEKDPALTAKILQLANSSFFGTLKKIIGIRQAIIHIGLEEAINAVCLFFYKDMLPKFPQLKDFSGKDYWDHSWACATANRMLGHPSHTPLVKVSPGELYIIGLLHGIGKLILAINYPDDFQKCFQNSCKISQPLAQREKDIFGTTDTEIAYALLKSWNFPEHICTAIRYYLSPHAATKQYREITALTQLAYVIANTSGIGNSGDTLNCNISQTYILNNWIMPSAEKKQQEMIIKDIYATLTKKRQTVDLANGVKTSEDLPDQQAEKLRKTSSTKNTPAKGVITRVLSLFK